MRPAASSAARFDLRAAQIDTDPVVMHAAILVERPPGNHCLAAGDGPELRAATLPRIATSLRSFDASTSPPIRRGLDLLGVRMRDAHRASERCAPESALPTAP